MNHSTRLAVLIDAENIPHHMADQVFALIAPLGRATVRRLYGDFAGQAGSWAGAAATHALEARHCFAPARGKNGADIALAVGAMELLCDGAVDGFCIVSSDADFAALARRIREDGRLAYGIGRSGTAEGYRNACTQFLTLHPPAVVAVARPAPAAHAALAAIRRALESCASVDDGWYHMGAFGTAAKREGIDPKAYGVSGIGKLLRATGQFTFDKPHHFRPTVLRAVTGGQ